MEDTSNLALGSSTSDECTISSLAIPTELQKESPQILSQNISDTNPDDAEHDEESVTDLQSVLNKISESLKTINQETMLREEKNDTIVSSEIVTKSLENEQEGLDKTLDKTYEKNDVDDNTDAINRTDNENLKFNSSEKSIEISLDNSALISDQTITNVEENKNVSLVEKNSELSTENMEEYKIPEILTIENIKEIKSSVPIEEIMENEDTINEIITEKAIDENSAEQNIQNTSIKDTSRLEIENTEKIESAISLNQEDNSLKTTNTTEEILPSRTAGIDDQKAESPKACEQMEILEDDYDVVAIEEPTTIIDLDDDENESSEQIEKMEIDDKISAAVDQIIEKTSENQDKDNIDDISKNENEKSNSTKDEVTISVPVDRYIFRNKECINYECKSQNCNIYYQAPIFVLNFYKMTIKPNKAQYICENCYDDSVDKYQEWCNIMVDEQPLLKSNFTQKKNEFVEILDSSDEEDNQLTKLANENGDFSENTVELLQNELDNIISDVFGRVKISNQLTWSKTILQHRQLKLQEDSDYITDTLMKLQKNADNMNNSLYQCPKIEMKVLAPLDLNSGKPYVLGEATQYNQYTIPPLGEICRPKIELHGLYFAAKNKVMASWLPCKVMEYADYPLNYAKNIQYYKIKFVKIKIPTLKTVPAKHMAYNDAPKVQLAIGTRVIALFDATTLSKSKDTEIKSAFYPGIIAEALQSYNNYRYLIFFDDGYTQYVHHRDVRLICEASLNVWEDIHPGSREFIQNYLINYKKNRPMVQVKKGQTMITEVNGKWIYAKVIDVDASLINMLFEGQKNHTEWIYRGSTRLGPLFKATQKTNLPAVTRMPRRSEPYVRYMQDDDNSLRRETAMKSTATVTTVEPVPVRAVAKKTTSRQETTPTPPPASSSAPVKHLNNSTIFVDDEEPKGKLVYYSAKIDSNPPPKPYQEHKCSTLCITRKITIGHNYGILSKPLLNGWERAIYKIKGKKQAVVYTGPCGKRFRTMQEVHNYLRQTKNALNVENFVFDPECGCLTEYQVQRCIVNKSDITEGKEIMPIQCVNYYDHTMPPECIYSAVRLPTEGVNINTDEEFLVGCDCEDDCSDKSKCSCWQLTLEGAKYGNLHTPINNVGYHYKRLPEPVPTGIYECNSRCKCSKQCINRVVQHPLETKLQVFKTSNRGWGLRCINDVPKGSFICIYAGDLLTEQKANEGGANSGDEYFAELDYIEVAERLKDGYESDVPEDNESDDDEDQYFPENDSDEEFRPSRSVNRKLVINTRNLIKKSKSEGGGNDENDEQERQAINFEPNTSLANADEENSVTKYQSMRKLFGKHEYCYIMDAKNIGNVGRYFNHSCSPNLFVQNVFVDTHDLRFPWVAFFALSQIRAGTELTWNYNYEVGVVPGKVLYCECGAPNCRGRLL